ncbi:MAG: NUDIX domain-containing protein [Flavobacteriia bacterium]|nr:NUDIX domain-containing protein [Flavobacteriia bacterium]
MSKPFNVRIYGLLIHNHRLMILEEPFMGEIVKKFPGGGLEFGEGTRDCLKREFKEELNLDIRVGEHFYTQDFFLQSGLDPKEQILMIYYRVELTDISQLHVEEAAIKELIWIDLDMLSEDDLSLPTDKIVTRMLLSKIEIEKIGREDNPKFHDDDD